MSSYLVMARRVLSLRCRQISDLVRLQLLDRN